MTKQCKPVVVPRQLQLNKRIVYDLTDKSKLTPFVLSLCSPKLQSVERMTEECTSQPATVKPSLPQNSIKSKTSSESVSPPKQKQKVSSLRELLNQQNEGRPNHVSQVVNKFILSPSSHHSFAPKFVMMPVQQPANKLEAPKSQLKHMVINTKLVSPSIHATGSKFTTPYSMLTKPHPSSSNSSAHRTRNMQPYCFTNFCPTPAACCTAVICPVMDTVEKWLNCNRNLLYKILSSVATSLNLLKATLEMLNKHKERSTEHRVLKWVGISLLLLTRYKIKNVLSTGSPMPGYLYGMWGQLNNFFTIYEGCLRIVRTKRRQAASPVDFSNLRQEDQTFEEVINYMFRQYNKVDTKAGLPTTNNMHLLSNFIAGLDVELQNEQSTGEQSNRRITSVLQTPSCHYHIQHFTRDGVRIWNLQKPSTNSKTFTNKGINAIGKHNT